MTNIEHVIEEREYYVVAWVDGHTVTRDFKTAQELASMVYGTINGPLVLPVPIPVTEGGIVGD